MHRRRLRPRRLSPLLLPLKCAHEEPVFASSVRALATSALPSLPTSRCYFHQFITITIITVVVYSLLPLRDSFFSRQPLESVAAGHVHARALWSRFLFVCCVRTARAILLCAAPCHRAAAVSVREEQRGIVVAMFAVVAAAASIGTCAALALDTRPHHLIPLPSPCGRPRVHRSLRHVSIHMTGTAAL